MSFVERCRQRHLGSEGGDEGFTLIELLVVLLIIGILLAIAIPTFLSVTKGANSTAAQSNLQNALTGAKTYFTDNNQSYTGLTSTGGITSDIQQIGTGLSGFNSPSGTASTASNDISWSVGNSGSSLALTAWAPGANECWGIVDVTGSGSTAMDGVTSSTAVGTYYFVTQGSTASACKAGSVTATKFSSNGFGTL